MKLGLSDDSIAQIEPMLTNRAIMLQAAYQNRRVVPGYFTWNLMSVAAATSTRSVSITHSGDERPRPMPITVRDPPRSFLPASVDRSTRS